MNSLTKALVDIGLALRESASAQRELAASQQATATACQRVAEAVREHARTMAEHPGAKGFFPLSGDGFDPFFPIPQVGHTNPETKEHVVVVDLATEPESGCCGGVTCAPTDTPISGPPAGGESGPPPHPGGPAADTAP